MSDYAPYSSALEKFFAEIAADPSKDTLYAAQIITPYVNPTTGGAYISKDSLDAPPDANFIPTRNIDYILDNAPRDSYTQETPLPTYVDLNTGESFVPKSADDKPPPGYLPTDSLAALLEEVPYTGSKKYDIPLLSEKIDPIPLNYTPKNQSANPILNPAAKYHSVNINKATPTPRGLAQLAAPRTGPELLEENAMMTTRPTLRTNFQIPPGASGYVQDDMTTRPTLRTNFQTLPDASGYARGGMVDQAQDLAGMGRRGDSMLVHMAPQEVRGLQQLAAMDGTSLTINPYTGMPEAFNLKKLFKGVAKLLPFVLPFIPGIGPLASAALSGVAGGFAGDKKGFDFKRGLMSGLMSYGVGQLGRGLSAAGQAGGTAASSAAAGFTPEMAMSGMPEAAFASSAAPAAAMAGFTPEMAMSGMPEAAMAGSTPSMTAAASSAGFTPEMAMSGMPEAAMAGTAPPPSYTPTPAAAPSSFIDQLSEGVKNTPQNISNMGRGVQQLFMENPSAADAFKQGATGSFMGAKISPLMAAGMGVMGYGGVEGADEQNKYEAEIEAKKAEEEERRRKYLEVFTRLMGPIPVYGRNPAQFGRSRFAEGGEIDMGGTTGMMNEPRMVAGAGDGMSDNVPASIEGVQEARLADGEFVIPADVVADIGNGSSSAGARKLYQMMNRIREARHDTDKQPPQINATRYMPA
jgi:hypothetical protein